MIACCIFDLDGVLVDTARYHYEAWASLARDLGFVFTPEQGEATKGVSRMASLEIVLRAGGLQDRFTAAERERLAAEKNARYLAAVARMTPAGRNTRPRPPSDHEPIQSLPRLAERESASAAERNACLSWPLVAR